MAKKAAAKSEVKESVVVDESTDFEDEFDKIAEAKASPDPDSTEELDSAGGGGEGVSDAKDGDSDAIKAKKEDPDPDPKAKKDPDPDPIADPYKGMDEATKARFVTLEEANTKLTHRLDSDSGRISAFQRQVNDLKKGSKAAAAAKPTPNQIADAMKGTDEGWDKFQEDYPEVATAIDRRLEMAGKATQETVDQTLAPVVERQAQIETTVANTATQTKVDAVAEIYPTWSTAVQTPDFVDWLQKQPPGIAALSESDDTQDASALIGMYDDYLVANGKPTLKKETTPEPASKKDEEAAGADESDLAKKRAQQLEDGTTIDSKNAKIDTGSDTGGDFEAAFAFHAKRKDAKRATA